MDLVISPTALRGLERHHGHEQPWTDKDVLGWLVQRLGLLLGNAEAEEEQAVARAAKRAEHMLTNDD
jgi:hypothetical protein